jgi:hypothetical protein
MKDTYEIIRSSWHHKVMLTINKTLQFHKHFFFPNKMKRKSACFFSCEKGLNVDPSPIQNDLEAQGTNTSIGRKHWWSSIVNQIFLPHLDSLKWPMWPSTSHGKHTIWLESNPWHHSRGLVRDPLKCTCNLIVKCPKRDPYATTELEWQNKRSLCPHGFSRD